MNITFSDWIEKQYVLWQAENAKKKTIAEFCDWLGVTRDDYNNWKRGVKPAVHDVDAIALRLGLDVYEVVGMEKPDPDLYTIRAKWQDLPKEARRRLAEEAGVYSATGPTAGGERREKVSGITNVDLDKMVRAGKISPMLAAILKNWDTAPQDVKDKILELLEKSKKRKQRAGESKAD